VPRDDRWTYVPDRLRRRYDRELVSVPNAVRSAAAGFGDAEAVVDGTTRLTFAELYAAMLDSVRAMMTLGVRRGDRVGLWAPNSVYWIVAALGVLGAGAVLVPLNTRFRGEEAAYILRRSGARALLTVGDFLGNDYVSMLADADPDSPVLRRTVLLPDSGAAAVDTLTWSDLLAAGTALPVQSAEAAVDSVTAEDLSDIIFTSGTTGHPKGVMITHGQSLRAHGWLTKAMGFRRGDRYLIVPPFFHTFGYKAGWLACVIHGVTAIPVSVFDPQQALELIATEKVSILCGPPTLFEDLLAARERVYDLSSLRLTMPAAAHTSPDLMLRIRAQLHVDVTHSGYGLTEATSSVTSTLPGVDDLDDILHTVGRAVPGVELRVVNDAGADVEPGTPGELWVRGYNVMRGYWNDPERTAETITEDGWLRTGDIATIDNRGYVRITDRKKDMIIVGGFNVYPAEVERLMAAHPAIREVAVVGAPDARLGEVPVAFVVGDLEPDGETALTLWAREQMANFKVPRHVVTLDSLPRNASGKVLKNELRARARTLVAAERHGVNGPLVR
jgi:acyl-CoA synthetase (AMP-forming)/AMP-acid ligase II